MLKKGLFYLLIAFALVACIKEEYFIDGNIDLGNAEPIFAIPLAFTELTLGDLERELDTESVIDNQEGEILAIVYSQEVIEFTLEDLLDLPDQQTSGSYEADIFTAALLNASQPGAQITIDQNFDLPFQFTNGEILDSIRFQQATLSLNATSTFRHDVEVSFTIPELSLNGVIFQESTTLDYTGTIPVELSTDFDVSDHLLDFTQSTSNSLTIQASFTVTHSGESTQPGDLLDFEIVLSSNSIRHAYGYLGQYTGLAESNTQQVDFFQDPNGTEFYLADPAMELLFSNSSGIPMQVDVTSIYDPAGYGGTVISGDGLEAIPVIAAAEFPGEIAFTTHRIDNSNIDPDLSDLLNTGPFDLTYTAEAITNPDGFAQNWVLDTSTVSMTASIIVPLHGYASSYIFSDTLQSNLTESLRTFNDSLGVVSLDDIETLQLRLIADNGLPIDAQVQFIFLNNQFQVVDSLFHGNNLENLVQSGLVDHSLPPSHPDHGRVLSPVRKITDVELTRERIELLLDNEITFVVVRAKGNTDQANQGAVVKFYPDYVLDIQLSAKIETNFDLSE